MLSPVRQLDQAAGVRCQKLWLQHCLELAKKMNANLEDLVQRTDVLIAE
jgi:hypothetical protein